MTVLNSDAFLDTFSAIEQWLRKQLPPTDRFTPFYSLVESVSAKNQAVRRCRDDLKEFADLRNAIVHDRSDGRVIAEPNDRAVADFERIRIALIKPPTVIPAFQQPVKTLDAGDQVGKAVAMMRAGSFSQLPILDGGKFAGLLTSKTIVRWMAEAARSDNAVLMATRIESVLPHAEDADNACFLSRRATLYEAVARFEEFTARGRELDAILLTEDGRPEQSLMGIMTIYDIPSILERIGVRRG